MGSGYGKLDDHISSHLENKKHLDTFALRNEIIQDLSSFHELPDFDSKQPEKDAKHFIHAANTIIKGNDAQVLFVFFTEWINHSTFPNFKKYFSDINHFKLVFPSIETVIRNYIAKTDSVPAKLALQLLTIIGPETGSQVEEYSNLFLPLLRPIFSRLPDYKHHQLDSFIGQHVVDILIRIIKYYDGINNSVHEGIREKIIKSAGEEGWENMNYGHTVTSSALLNALKEKQLIGEIVKAPVTTEGNSTVVDIWKGHEEEKAHLDKSIQDQLDYEANQGNRDKASRQQAKKELDNKLTAIAKRAGISVSTLKSQMRANGVKMPTFD